jgi:hypothetical protein
MLNWVSARLGMRELRLYAVASCRRVWALLGERCRQAVEAAEAWADREVSWELVAKQRRAADALFAQTYLSADPETRRRASLAWACRLAAARTRVEVNRASWRISEVLAPDNIRPVRDPTQCALLRDIVGNPFRPAEGRLACSPEVRAWAESAYRQRDFSSLPVLADLLEETGAAGAEALGHCRRPGVHVRGCWVIDWALSKRPPAQDRRRT